MISKIISTNPAIMCDEIQRLKDQNIKTSNEISDIESVYSEMGAKNLIPYPWYAPSGTSGRGITFTYSGEGYVSLEGTASTTQQPFFSLTSATGSTKNLKIVSGKKYTLSVDRTDDRIWAIIYLRTTDGQTANVESNTVYEDGSVNHVTSSDYISLRSGINHISGTFEIITSGEYYLQVDIRVAANTGVYSASDDKAKVMLRIAEDLNDTWEPYAKTNKQLTDDIAALNSDLRCTETTAGVYQLQATVDAQGAITYSWEEVE